MIIYGTRSKELGSNRISGEQCLNCESKEIYVIGVSKYAHLFWIPLLPYSKKVHPVCRNCGLKINKRDISQRMINKISLAKKEFKIPFYLFSGVIIISLLIIYGIYTSNKHNIDVAKNIKNLTIKDIVVFKNEGNTYSFGKITDIKSDTIFFNFSNYVFENRTPSETSYYLEKIKVPDFYNKKPYYFKQKEIDSLFKNGRITDLYKKPK